mmetsp:Transcript_26349/g.30113  ORF Transcript_26349/g.30113 Transcript_26349/m.30113 type:complete len:735 (+) Transcript_26349:86-2290(+)
MISPSTDITDASIPISDDNCIRDDHDDHDPPEQIDQSSAENRNLHQKNTPSSVTAWSSFTSSKKQHQSPIINFAEIMNDQNNDRIAGRAAFSNNNVVVDGGTLSLADIQSEQERLFASLSQPEKLQQQQQYNQNNNQEGAHSDEEELRLIELVMRQSLAESDINNNSDTDSKPLSVEKEYLGYDQKLDAAASKKNDDGNANNNNADNATSSTDAATKAIAVTLGTSIDAVEKEMIEAALREADTKERRDADAKSLRLVMQLHQEEITRARQLQRHQQETAMTGNVRTMTRAEFEAEREGDKNFASNHLDEYEIYENETDTGFRMNASSTATSSKSSQQKQQQPSGWYRRDRNTIVGPENEVRTKHDTKVQGQTNATFLDLDVVDDDTRRRVHIGNTAFNAFRKNVAGKGNRGTSKGVATHGTGRAGSDADTIKGGTLDHHVQLQISKAINACLIERCNGAVKQGKEAVVYHANGGRNGSNTIIDDRIDNDDDGFDVAVKVFKRIKEFRGRGDYVDGDPRYAGRPFKSFTDREQLEVWTEKEYRNLVRAHRSKVPVPNPIHYKENVIFMRFIGEGGWPAPQLREIRIRRGSPKWYALYEQVVGSVQRLFQDARLVHGDLSEYNILVAPQSQVELSCQKCLHDIEENTAADNFKNGDVLDDLQTVLIDFGQAVEVRHPKAEELLRRDLKRVNEFFTKQGTTKTMSVEDAMTFVIGDKHTFINIENINMQAKSEQCI